MKYCSKCGKQLFDEAVICPGCECPVGECGGRSNVTAVKSKAEETNGLATTAIVFAFLMPVVGLILGIIGTCKYRNEEYRRKSTSAIIVSIGMWIAYFCIIYLTMM